MVKKLYADKTTPIGDICKSFHISRMTLWRYVNAGRSERAQALAVRAPSSA